MLASVCKFCRQIRNSDKYSEEFFLSFFFLPSFFHSFISASLSSSLFLFLFCYNFLILNTEKLLFQHVISENLAGEIPRENPDDLEFLICC